MMETGLLFLAAFSLYFVPGYLVLGMFRTLSSWERVGASFAVSMTLFALIEFFVYLYGGPQRSLNTACLVLLIFFAGLGWWLRGAPGLDRPGIWLLISYFGFTIQIVLLDAVLPIYPDMWTFDWIEHYFRSIFYLNQLPTDNSYWIFSVPTRLPGYNLNGAFFLSTVRGRTAGSGSRSTWRASNIRCLDRRPCRLRVLPVSNLQCDPERSLLPGCDPAGPAPAGRTRGCPGGDCCCFSTQACCTMLVLPGPSCAVPT